jgi:hypothetical protein
MTLDPSTIERCLEVLGSLVRGLPKLNAEFEGSIETFFKGSRPGAADDLRETLLAGRRHLEWFLLEHHSATLRGSVAEKLAPAYGDAVAACLAEDDDHEGMGAALELALEALLRSHTGIFEAESTDTEEAVWARDLGGFGTYALRTAGLEGRLRHGDLLVGRLYPTGDGGNVASPTIAIVRSEEIRTALTADLSRVREESSVNVLRIGQRDLEAMFFATSDSGPRARVEAEPAQAQEHPEEPALDSAESALETLLAAGLADPMAREALRVLAAAPRDPERLVHGLEDPLAKVMESLAFETDVDLEAARTALIKAWDLTSKVAASPAAPGAPSKPTEPSDDAEREAAIDAFARGRARGEDAASLLQKLEEDLGIAGDGPGEGIAERIAEEGAETAAPDFPGVVGAMVDEMRWEMTATRDGFDVETLAPLQHLANFARPIGVFEELKGRDLFQFTTFWIQETRALASDPEAMALVAALREFCEWALDAHEVDLGSEFLDALDGLETSLPRLRRANDALELGPSEPAEGEGDGYEVLAVDRQQPASFETSGDRLAPRGGGESLTVILPEPLRGLLSAGDYVRATISLEGHARVFCCYPPEARSLMGG